MSTLQPAWMARAASGAAAVVAMSFGLLACGGPRTAEDAGTARDFFRGKTLTYIVATDPGGGYDTYGRLIAKYLGRHLGAATVVVKNVPGGGHIKGTNALFTAAPDGLTLGTFNTGLILAQILGRKGLAGDLRNLSWIGKAAREPRVLVVSAKSGFRSVDDLRRATRPILIGTNGVGNESYYDALLMAHVFGLRIRLVFGLSSRDAQLSMLRGEIDAEFGAASTHERFIENGYGAALLRIGRDAAVDDGIPNAAQLVTDPQAQAIVRFLEVLVELMRWTAGPPGIPSDRLAVLREAYTAALQDPELQAEARKLNIPLAPMDGGSLEAEIGRALDPGQDTLALIVSIVGREIRQLP